MGKYILTISSVTVEDESYETYGIACIDNDTVTKCFNDVSTDRNAVERTIKMFNENELDPEQLLDAIEDSII